MSILTEYGRTVAMEQVAKYAIDRDRKLRLAEKMNSSKLIREAAAIQKLIDGLQEKIDYSNAHLDEIRLESEIRRQRSKAWRAHVRSIIRNGTLLDLAEVIFQQVTR